MSIEVTIYGTNEKLELMTDAIDSYHDWENAAKTIKYGMISLFNGKTLEVVETVAEIKAKIDAVDYLKKISQYLDSMDSAIDDIKHEVKGLRRL